MGNICCESSPNDGTELIDLPKPSTFRLKDKYSIWEYGTPFKRTLFCPFKNAVNEAEVVDEDGKALGYCTIESLAEVLTTPAWKEIRNRDSDLCKLILSPAFKNPKKKHTEDQIDKEALILFALLHCADNKKPLQKARGFYELL